MAYENILFEKDGAVGSLTINRPKSLNALNPATLHEIAACLQDVRRDQSIHCLIISGDMIDAETALRYGLVNKVVPVADLMSEAKALAHKLAAKPPVAIRQAKTAINTGIDLDLENGCRFENEAFALTFATADKVEGMKAFLEKRAANFKGE